MVALHDDTVDRTTDGTGCAASFTLDAIKQLDAARGTPLEGQGVTIPTLDEALDALDIDVNIEVKVAGDACPPIDVARLADDVADDHRQLLQRRNARAARGSRHRPGAAPPQPTILTDDLELTARLRREACKAE